MKNFHIIEVSFIPATNSKDARIKIYSERFGKKLIYPLSRDFDTIYLQAETILTAQGFNVLGMGLIKGGYAIITDTFQAII